MIIGSLVSYGFIYKSIQQLDASANYSDSSLERSREAGALLTLILEQTNALRGYVIKGDVKFLKTYQETKKSFDAALNKLGAHASNATERDQIVRMRVEMRRWRAEVGDRVVSLMEQPETRMQAADLSGVKSLTTLRAIEKEIDATAAAATKAGQADKAGAIAAAMLTMLIGGVGSIVIAGVMGWLLARTIAKPVSQLTDAMHRLAKGDNDIVIPGSGRKDELGLMASAVEVFRDAALQKSRLEEDAERTRRAAEEMRALNDAEREAARAEQAMVVQSLATGLEQLSLGELAFRLAVAFPSDYEKLRTDFNTAMEKLQATVSIIAHNSVGIRGGADEISRAADELSRRTEQQAANLEETAAALDEITVTVRRTAEGAAEARTVVSAAKLDAEQSKAVVRQATDAMSAIKKSSEQIGDIIGVIDEIAFQTNLLALNAGVEAARAGDSGRGFAVVAQEVRALAQRSADAAKEIKALISTSTGQVGVGVDLVDQTGNSLQRIAQQVMEINTVVTAISASTKEQSSGLEQVNKAINSMDQFTQQNAAMVEQSTAASHTLASEADVLAEQVAQFKLTGSSAQAGRSRVNSSHGSNLAQTIAA
jgi:methyl-accepting chemotaxis protein